MWPSFIINSVIASLLMSIKNPAKALQLRQQMLNVFYAIKAAYPGDPDFK